MQANFLSRLLSNQKEILKRGMTLTEQKSKDTTFKLRSIAIKKKNIIYWLDTPEGVGPIDNRPSID